MTALPFDNIPADLRPQLRSLVASASFEEAICLIDLYLEQHQTMVADLLLVKAYCQFEDGLTVMVDEIAKRGEQALNLLSQAEEAGADLVFVRAYRTEIERHLQEERKRESEVVALLEKPLETLDFREASELAYLLSEMGGTQNHKKAATLFQIAESLCPKDSDPTYFRFRRAISLADAGDWFECEPTLLEMASAKTSRQEEDAIANDFELAVNRLLKRAIEQQDKSRFVELWSEAHATSAKEFPFDHFPYARPTQDMVLDAALNWELTEILNHVVNVIETHRRKNTISNTTQVALTKARQRLRQ